MFKLLKSFIWAEPKADPLDQAFAVIETQEETPEEETERATEYTCFNKVGEITKANKRNCFVIDGLYTYISDEDNFVVGDKVSYDLFKDRNVLKVTNVKLLDEWNDDLTAEQQKKWCMRSEIGQVYKREGRVMFITPHDVKVNLNTVSSEFIPRVGDWVDYEAKAEIDEGVTNLCGKILEVTKIRPLRTKIVKGIIRSFNNNDFTGVIEREVFFDREALAEGYLPRIGDRIIAEAVESTQGSYLWRALTVILQNSLQKSVDFLEIKVPKLLNYKKDIEGVFITNDLIVDTYKFNDDFKLPVMIRNDNLTAIELLDIKFDSQIPQVTLAEAFLPQTVLKEGATTIMFNVNAKTVGKSVEVVVFIFNNFIIGRNITINLHTDNKNVPNKPYKHNLNHINQMRDFRSKSEVQTIRGERINVAPRFVGGRMGEYRIPDEIWRIFLKYDDRSSNNRNIYHELVDARPCLQDGLNMQCYEERLHTLLYIEEIECVIAMRKYDNPQTCFIKNGEFLMLEVENLAEKRPSIIIGDKIIATNPLQPSSHFEGFVHKVSAKHIYLKFFTLMHNTYQGEDYAVHAVQSRVPIRKLHHAVHLGMRNLGRDFLFPSKVVSRTPQVNFTYEEYFDDTNEKIEARRRSDEALDNSIESQQNVEDSGSKEMQGDLCSEGEKCSNEVDKRSNEMAKRSDEVAKCSKDVAKRSNEVSKCSNDVAKCLNEVAECSNKVAGCSNDVEKCSNEIAKCSNEVAQCSNDVARCSNDVARCSNDIAKCSNEVATRSNEVEKSSNKVIKCSNDIEKCLNNSEKRSNKTESNSSLNKCRIVEQKGLSLTVKVKPTLNECPQNLEATSTIEARNKNSLCEIKNVLNGQNNTQNADASNYNSNTKRLSLDSNSTEVSEQSNSSHETCPNATNAKTVAGKQYSRRSSDILKKAEEKIRKDSMNQQTFDISASNLNTEDDCPSEKVLKAASPPTRSSKDILKMAQEKIKKDQVEMERRAKENNEAMSTSNTSLVSHASSTSLLSTASLDSSTTNSNTNVEKSSSSAVMKKKMNTKEKLKMFQQKFEERQKQKEATEKQENEIKPKAAALTLEKPTKERLRQDFEKVQKYKKKKTVFEVINPWVEENKAGKTEAEKAQREGCKVDEIERNARLISDEMQNNALQSHFEVVESIKKRMLGDGAHNNDSLLKNTTKNNIEVTNNEKKGLSDETQKVEGILGDGAHDNNTLQKSVTKSNVEVTKKFVSGEVQNNVPKSHVGNVLGDVTHNNDTFQKNGEPEVLNNEIRNNVYKSENNKVTNHRYKNNYSSHDQRLQQRNNDSFSQRYNNYRQNNQKGSNSNNRTRKYEEPQTEEAVNAPFQLEWYDQSLNYYQKEAVRNILLGEARPLPYIIFGPPGTGKTVTVIESILQIIRMIPHSRILVGAPSNSAADIIAVRLIDSGCFKPGDLVRFVSYKSVLENSIPSKLVPYSATGSISREGTMSDEPMAMENGLTLGCTLSVIGRHRVTIGTCSALGTLHNMGFTKGHFTHIIVDEAGQCTEPEIMIPLVFLDVKQGQCILSGDPMQLGPVINSRQASEFGLGDSFLERLLHRFPYVRDVKGFNTCGGYDPRLITCLVYNYRSLPGIINLSNQLFYHSELRATLSDKTSEEALFLKKLGSILPSPEGKIASLIFHGLDSQNFQGEDSPSWFNPGEAGQVFYYVNEFYRLGVKSTEIGIISPYNKQVKQIRSILIEAGFEMPKIGTVEEFQGNEFNVIILSTVRSNADLINNDVTHSLGFISNPKRLNVALTRAQCLCIVVGNPFLLSHDPYWRSLILHCIDNGSYIGCALNPKK